MDSEAILSLYTWAPGVCFRHPDRGEADTARIKTLHPRASADQELRACRECVLGLETERRCAAERSEGPYEPGHVAE